MRVFKSILVIFLASIMILSCAKKLKEPEEVVKKMAEKYGKQAQKGIKSIDAKLSFNYEGDIPEDELPANLPREFNFLTSMMGRFDIEGGLEFCATRKPFRVFAKTSGDFGEMEMYISEKTEKMTIVLPDEEKYTEIDFDKDDVEGFMEELEDAEKELKGEDIAKEVDEGVDDMWDEMEKVIDIELAKDLEKTNLGKAYKLTFEPKKPEDADEEDIPVKGKAELYIVHAKWIPAKFTFNFDYQEEPRYSSYYPRSPYSSRRQTESSTKTVKGSFEFERLKINSRISGSKFEPKTKGYKEIDEDELAELAMKRLQSFMEKSIKEE